MIDSPGYLVVGGEVFDEVVEAPSALHGTFLKMLRDLRRNPTASGTMEIDTARGDWGDTPALIASLDGLTLSYHVTGRYILLVLVAWV